VDAILPPAFVLYLRRSKGRAGIGRQRTVTTAHITSIGGQITAEFTDTDRTAYRKVGGKRPERENFDAMLTYLRAHPGIGVAAWHADRLVRSSDDTEELIRICAAGGHLVETPRGGSYNLATATGRKRLRADAVDAAYEVDHAIERIIAAKVEAVAAGQWLGGRRPFGYAKDGVTVRKAEAAALRDATTAIIAGASLASVTRRWNATGITTSTGRAWTPREVSRVLRRARNAGLLEHHGRVAGSACWPAIVTEAHWQACKAILEDPSRRTSPGPDRRHLLSGIARCGICGGPLIATKAAGNGRAPRPIYRCRTKDGRAHVARDQATLDGWITAIVVARLSRPDVVLEPPTEDTALLHAEIAATRAQLDDLATEAAGRRITVRQMATVSQALMADLESQQARLAAAARPTVLAPFAADHDTAVVWDMLDLDRKRAVLAELMTITVHAAPKGRTRGWQPGQPYFDPASVRIEWRHG
jgi:DNA invertase Pin-like site-specific DNA recombinase